MGHDARRTSVVLVGLAATAALGLGATSCGAGAPEGLGPPQAADALARTLDLDAEQTSCLRDGFEQDPSAAAVLATDEAPTDEDRDGFLVLIRTCLPPDRFAATLAATARSELPEATDAQVRCVHDNVAALAPAEQDRLYLYFANPAVLDVADVGQAGVDLFASCDLVEVGDPGAGSVTTTTP